MAVIRSRWLVLGMCSGLLAGCGGGNTTTGGGGGNGGGGGGGGGNNATAVAIAFEGPALPTVIAAKIGTGAFTAQTLSGNTLTLSIPSGTTNYAVAFLCPAEVEGQSSDQAEYVWEGSTTDGTSLNFLCLSIPNSTFTLTGNLNASAIPGVETFQVDSQGAASTLGSAGGVGGGPTTSFDVPAPTGSDRVLVLANSLKNDGPAAAKNFDNQTVPGALNSGNTVTFGAADQTTPEAITYNSLPSGYSYNGTTVSLKMAGALVEDSYASAANSQYMALPTAATETGDVYYLDAGALYETSSSGAYPQVYAGTTTSGGPVSLTFPAPWNNPSAPTPAALPSFNIDYTGFSGQQNVSQNAFIVWNVGSGSAIATYEISVEASASYQNGATTLAIPDLSSLAGFMTAPASGTQVTWADWMEQQSYSLTSPTPVNATWSTAESAGTYTAP